MNVNFNAYANRWVSSREMPKAETMSAPKKDTASSAPAGADEDRVFLSQEGRQAAAPRDKDPFSEMKTAVRDGDLAALAKAVKEKAGKLEIHWDASVDPGGKIYSAAYVEALLRQYEEASSTVEAYYAEAHRENLSFDDPYTHLMQKYRVEDSPYFRSDMTKHERDMAFAQERAMLWGGHMALNDPYALASSGGVLNIKDTDQIAHQAARDKLDGLIQERKAQLKGKY